MKTPGPKPIHDPQLAGVRYPQPAPWPDHRASSIQGTNALDAVREWVFLILVFSMPFESVDLGARGILSITKAIGFLLAAVSLPRIRYWAPHPPAAFWCFLLYFVAYTFLFMFEPYDSLLWRSAAGAATFFQSLVFLLIAIDLLRDEQVRKRMLWAMFIGCIFLSIFQILGLTNEELINERTGQAIEGRESALGEDPNNIANTLGTGFIALVGLAYARRNTSTLAKWLLVPAMASIGVAIVRTGSRSGLVAMVAGLSVLVLSGKNTWSKVRNLTVVFGVLLILVFIITQSEFARKRWENTLQNGSMAGREKITPVAINLFLEQPILGWGPSSHILEIGSRLGQTAGSRERAAHNLVLTVLLETGLVGGLPYVIGLLLCLRAAWKARNGPEELLPLIMMTSTLIYNMADSGHNRKRFWLVLAYVLAQQAWRGEKSKRT